MAVPTVIAVDWGSSNFRAFLTNQSAEIIDSRHSGCGLLHVNNRDFSGVLSVQIKAWLDAYPNIPIIMSGMIGAQQGWVEAPYLQCPVKLSKLVGSLTPVDFLPEHPTYIVPGLAVDNDAAADVMRGEETQLLGALAMVETPCTLFCLPGTHSKWVTINAGVVEDFRTYLSGELFQLLRKYSILSKSMLRQQRDWEAFEQALRKAEVPASLLNDLFSVRAEMLLGHLAPESTRDYLMGLLIGYEIMQSADLWDVAGRVGLVAAESIAPQYERAFQYYDIPLECVDVTAATLTGLVGIADSAGILEAC